MIHEKYGGDSNKIAPGFNLGGTCDEITDVVGAIVTLVDEDYYYDPDILIDGEHYVMRDKLSWQQIHKARF